MTRADIDADFAHDYAEFPTMVTVVLQHMATVPFTDEDQYIDALNAIITAAQNHLVRVLQQITPSDAVH
jgi:hypothetical protein